MFMYCRSSTDTLIPMSLAVVHVLPPSVVENTPISVPTYNVFGAAGRRAIARTGTCGRTPFPLPLRAVQVAPAFVVFQTLLDVKPPKVT